MISDDPGTGPDTKEAFMMKRVISLFLSFLLLLNIAPALAAGRLTVAQENFYCVDGYGYEGYVFAKLENTGNKPIMVNSAVFEIFGADEDVIGSTTYFTAYAQYLEPGEYTYLEASTDLKGIQSADEADDYMLSVSGKSEMDKKTVRLACACEYKENVQSGYSTYNYMYATVTNNTAQPLYGLRVVFALLDADGNLLYVKGDGLTSDQALMPGSSVIIRVYVHPDFAGFMKQNRLVPARLDAIAYAYADRE